MYELFPMFRLRTNSKMHALAISVEFDFFITKKYTNLAFMRCSLTNRYHSLPHLRFPCLRLIHLFDAIVFLVPLFVEQRLVLMCGLNIALEPYGTFKF